MRRAGGAGDVADALQKVVRSAPRTACSCQDGRVAVSSDTSEPQAGARARVSPTSTVADRETADLCRRRGVSVRGCVGGLYSSPK
jgi:hypothetical protein